MIIIDKNFFTSPCQHETVDDEVLVGRFVEERRGDNEEGVEPSPGLVHSLRDEVSWKRRLEDLLVFKRIVALCIWHAGIGEGGRGREDGEDGVTWKRGVCVCMTHVCKGGKDVRERRVVCACVCL